MTIVERERETYEAAWAMPQYHTYAPGEGYVHAFLEMSGAKPEGRGLTFKGIELARTKDTVLDAGCGSGRGALALKSAGFSVQMCDLTDSGLSDEAQALPFWPACLWMPLEPQVHRTYDWVYCCDVLEHVPTPFTMLVIARLLEVARHGVFLSIALGQDQFGQFIVGKPLHQTVQAFTAWKEQIAELGELVECRDLLHSGLYLVKPR